MNKNLLLLLLIPTFISCNNEKYYTEYYPSGNLKLKVQIDKDSIQNGTYEEYYDNGKLKSKTNYTNGKISDSLFNYFKNGQIKEKGTVKNNFQNGWWNYYNKNGELKEKSEWIFVSDSLHKNQSYYYDNKGNIKLEPSTFFEIEISDTLRIGKNAARINYVTNFNNREENLLSVIIENEYSESERKTDTFGDGTLKPYFGVSIYKTGKQKIKGKIQEKVLTITKDSDDLWTLETAEHYKYFEKDVYVWDKENETEIGKKLREEMISGSENN